MVNNCDDHLNRNHEPNDISKIEDLKTHINILINDQRSKQLEDS